MKRGFVLHHNGPPANCVGQPHSRCEAFWAAVKRYHQQRWPNSNDIAYSFGICPHGVRFVGRGWDRNQYAGGEDVVGHDDGPDSAWYSVLAFVGGDTSTSDTEAPTPDMVAGVAALIAEGRASGRCEPRVLPHSAFKPKPCPGPEFTIYARAWDNQPLPTHPRLSDPEEPEMMIVQSKKNGAAILVTGNAAVLVVNSAELATLKAAGVPHVGVSHDQFTRYEPLRFNGDRVNTARAALAASVGSAVGAAVVKALPEGTASGVTVEQIGEAAEAAAETAVRRVFADAAD